MTAKVASPASPAEDLACRGPLKAKRLLYTEDQLSFTRKVSQTPTKQGHSVVCAAFIRLLMSPAFPLLRSCVFFFLSTFFYSCASFCFPTTFAERLFFPCHSAASVFSLSTRPDPSLQTPVGCESRHIKALFDRTKARKRGNSGQLVLLSGTPACHAFNSLSRCLFPL